MPGELGQSVVRCKGDVPDGSVLVEVRERSPACAFKRVPDGSVLSK